MQIIGLIPSIKEKKNQDKRKHVIKKKKASWLLLTFFSKSELQLYGWSLMADAHLVKSAYCHGSGHSTSFLFCSKTLLHVASNWEVEGVN